MSAKVVCAVTIPVMVMAQMSEDATPKVRHETRCNDLSATARPVRMPHQKAVAARLAAVALVR